MQHYKLKAPIRTMKTSYIIGPALPLKCNQRPAVTHAYTYIYVSNCMSSIIIILIKHSTYMLWNTVIINTYITLMLCITHNINTLCKDTLVIINIQLHHVISTLGLLSHAAPCIKTKDGWKWVKSLVLMIESTLPQLLDGFANFNILHAWSNIITTFFSLVVVRNSLSNHHTSIQSTTDSPYCFNYSHLSKNVPHPLFLPLCIAYKSSPLSPDHSISQFQFSVQQNLFLA